MEGKGRGARGGEARVEGFKLLTFELIADEPAAAAFQDRRPPDPTCPVLHPAVGRKPVDSAPICADQPAHRTARVASDDGSRTRAAPRWPDTERREKRSALGESSSRPHGGREPAFERWAVSLARTARTAHVTPPERQKGFVARHVVRSATRGSEDLGPNRKSRRNGEDSTETRRGRKCRAPLIL